MWLCSLLSPNKYMSCNIFLIVGKCRWTLYCPWWASSSLFSIRMIQTWVHMRTKCWEFSNFVHLQLHHKIVIWISDVANGLSKLFTHDCTHHWSINLCHKVVIFILMVNCQPSLGYGHPLSLMLINRLTWTLSTRKLRLLSLFSLTFIWVFALFKVFNHLPLLLYFTRLSTLYFSHMSCWSLHLISSAG